MGTKVMVSMTPTAQYMGAVAMSPTTKAPQSGAAPKMAATVRGKASSKTMTLRFQILPSRWTESM